MHIEPRHGSTVDRKRDLTIINAGACQVDIPEQDGEFSIGHDPSNAAPKRSRQAQLHSTGASDPRSLVGQATNRLLKELTCLMQKSQSNDVGVRSVGRIARGCARRRSDAETVERGGGRLTVMVGSAGRPVGGGV